LLFHRPDDWRLAHIKPIPKSGSSPKISNFRPISSNSSTSIVLERMLKDHLLQFCFENNTFTETQFGFLPSRSVETQLLACTYLWSQYIENGIPVDVVYFDINKAFDTVCHSKLLFKLYKMGIKGYLLSWLQSYLNNRYRIVSISGSFSEKVYYHQGYRKVIA